MSSPKNLRLPAQQERVAVTIATKNRPAYLAALLASLIQQTYPHWLLVLNDQSDTPVTETAAVRDLLDVMRAQGHPVLLFASATPTDRYQRLLDAAPPEIEFIHRIDDDVLLTPNYLETLLRVFAYFPFKPLAAVGGCLAGAHAQPLSLSRALAQPNWYPRLDKPTWRLQGHFYRERECIEMQSLWGCAMCYRRSAAQAVGGWVVAGQSPQIFREDSDMSARWLVAGYELMMTTAARAWHLVAPDGGARRVTKTAQGNLFNSHRAEYQADENLFRARLAQLVPPNFQPPPPKRYRIADLENDVWKPFPLQNRRARAQSALLAHMPRPLQQRLRRMRQALIRR
jgi:GT2 family glycosyltransferase